jgi:hypothetical protein
MQAAGGWVAWGINPTGEGMPGTQALVAFQNSTALTVQEYNVTGAVQNSGAALVPGPVSANYSNYSATVVGGVATIFGTLTLAAGQSGKINQVWNRGPSVALATNRLAQHDLSGGNLLSAGSIDLSTGIASAVGLPHQTLKNVCMPPAPLSLIFLPLAPTFPRDNYKITDNWSGKAGELLLLVMSRSSFWGSVKLTSVFFSPFD